MIKFQTHNRQRHENEKQNAENGINGDIFVCIFANENKLADYFEKP